jgi:hypothetical protein
MSGEIIHLSKFHASQNTIERLIEERGILKILAEKINTYRDVDGVRPCNIVLLQKLSIIGEILDNGHSFNTGIYDPSRTSGYWDASLELSLQYPDLVIGNM